MHKPSFHGGRGLGHGQRSLEGRGAIVLAVGRVNHSTRGLALEDPLVDALAGWSLPVFVQSFGDNLPTLRPRMPGIPFVQLLAGRDPVDLEAIAAYADAVGPYKERILPRDAEGRSAAPPATRLAAWWR